MRLPMPTAFLPPLLLSLALAGCSSFKPAGPPAPSEAGAAAAPSLASEQRRLSELFRGTPVDFEIQADGSLRVTVPLRFSFDKGRHAVKPPLGAVLERIAKSQHKAGTRVHVSAPADPNSKGLMLATERATSARDYMVARGIEATRFSVSALGSGDTVVIVVADPAAH
jgi:outer membrane protein OmpA-like peptidoglycan-associated protein